MGLEPFARWITRYAGPIVLVAAGVTALAGAQLVDWSDRSSRLEIDPSLEDLLPLDDAERRYLERIEGIFGRTEAVVAAVYFDDAFAPASLDAVARMTERLESRPWVYRVWSLASAPSLHGDGDSFDLGRVAGGRTGEEEARALRRSVLSNPLYADTLVADGGAATALVVYLQPSYEDTPGSAAAVAEIRDVLHAEAGSAEVRLSGPPVVKAATGEALVNELSRMLPAIFVLVAVFLAAAFRSVRGVLLPLVTIGVALTWTLAVMVVSGRSLNLITAIVPPVVVVIGLAYGLHFLSAYYRVGHGEDGIRKTLADITLPLLMTGATTAAGFLALSLSPLQPIREFAWLSALGVLFMVALSLTLLPAMLAVFGCRKMDGPLALRWFTAFAERLGRFNLRHRRLVLGAGLALLAVAAAGSLNIRVGTDYIQGFAADHPVRADFQRIGADFGGATPLSVVLESPIENTFARPDMLRAVADFQDWLEAQPEVGAVTSLVDYVRVLNRALRGGDAPLAIPDDQSAIKQLLLFGGGESLEELADGSLSMVHLKVRATVSDSAAIGALVERTRARMEGLPAPVTGRMTGTPVLMSNAVDEIAGGQLLTIGAALLVVFLLLSALFTSFRVGAITLLPNLLPVMAYFGALGFAGITLNPTTSLIACIVLGIAVDDTLYYFARFNRDAQDLASEEKATQSALRTVIRPVTYTSLALIAGFLLMTTSELQNQVQFGALAAFTVGVAWLTDVTFTPALASRVCIVTLWDFLRLDLGRNPQRSIPLFEGLSLRQARIFALLSRLQEFRAGERVMSEGETAGDIFVVIDGELRAWVEREGEVVDLSRMRRGAVMGEVGHFAKRRTANVDAVSDVRLLRFDSDDLERLRRRYPRIAALVFRNLNAIQAKRLTETTQLLR